MLTYDNCPGSHLKSISKISITEVCVWVHSFLHQNHWLNDEDDEWMCLKITWFKTRHQRMHTPTWVKLRGPEITQWKISYKHALKWFQWSVFQIMVRNLKFQAFLAYHRATAQNGIIFKWIEYKFFCLIRNHKYLPLLDHQLKLDWHTPQSNHFWRLPQVWSKLNEYFSR